MATKFARDERAAPFDQIAAAHTDLPDLIIATGNLAERSRPDEYNDTLSLLNAMCETFRLDAHRIVVIPGSTDVNQLKCRAHFLECEASGEEPTPPYWEKWRHFATMLHRLHGAELPMDQPWSLAEFPRLRVVVAGLNSTMAESHRPEDRYGFLGEEQLRWFADQLASPTYRDWLRIGAVHHRPGRDATGELRDSDRFAEILGPHLDLVLHGQASGPGPQTIAPHGVPVLAGGRSGEWQLLTVRTDHLHRRAFLPGASLDGDERVPLPRPRSSRPAVRRSTTTHHSPVDRLLARVAEIYRLRYPGAGITPVRRPGSMDMGYLRISPGPGRGAGRHPPTEQHPVGVLDRTPTPDDVRWFADKVVARFRTGGISPDATLVHTGDPADQSLHEQAGNRRVEIVAFAEFQLGHDLDEFAAQQAAELRSDRVYPAAIYVPQRYTQLRRDLQPDTGAAPEPDVLTWLRRWIDRPRGRLVVVLGTFGHGKTFLLRELARRMRTDPTCRAVPVLIDLRGFEKAYSLDDLVAVQLSRRGQRQFDLDTFRYLRREGRIVLLFDGFDELAARISYDRATNHLDTFIQAAEGRAKVVVTSRDQHFLTDAEVLSALATRPEGGWQVVKLAGFDDDQILAYLTNRLGDRDTAAARLGALRGVEDLFGLSRNPRMLAFITDLGDRLIGTAKHVCGAVTAAGLYREILDRWLGHEAQRLDRLGQLAPGKADLKEAVTHLALRLWDAPEGSLGLDDLGAAAMISQLTSTAIGETAGLEPQETAHLLGSSTLLVRHGERRFAFVHHSVREWLIADHLAGQLAGQMVVPAGAPAAYGRLLGRPLPPLVIEFLCGIAGPDTVRTWAEWAVTDETVPPGVGRNAAEILRHLGIEPSGPSQMAGADLRGRDLSGRFLKMADLSGADLTSAWLVGTDLTGASLTSAVLVGARLDQASLRGADLTGADLTGASLLDADLHDAILTGTRLRRAVLVGATGATDAALDAADTLGAALPDGPPPQPQLGSSAAVLAIAADPRTGLVAGGYADGAVRIWDAATGVPLRTLSGHTGMVRAVAYDPAGEQIASAGDDATIRIWGTTTGTTIRMLTGHTGWIRAIAYSPDGHHLATAGHDETVRIWNVATGQCLHTLTGHTGWIRAIAYSPNGHHLATAGHDETVRIWNVATGQCLHTLTGHTGTVHAVAYSPSGDRVASAGDDRDLRIWDLATGTMRTLTGDDGVGRARWIRAVACAPDGRHLATAGDDSTIRIWNPDTGQILHAFAGHTGPISSITYMGDASRLATASDDGTIRIWDTASGTQLRVLRGDGGDSRALGFSPDGRWLATGTSEGAVHVWNATTGVAMLSLTGHMDAVTAISFSPDGGHLVTAADDSTIRIWRQDTGQCLRSLTGHAGPINSVVYAPDGRHLASGDDDRTVCVWNPGTGEILRTLAGHADGVNSVTFSPDSRHLATASDDHTVRIWNAATGQCLHVLRVHTSAVNAVAFSPGSRHLASGDEDGVVRVWSTASGRPTRALAGHDDAISSVTFSPDSRHLATASGDGTIRVWDVASGRLLAAVTAHAGPVSAIAFTPDGRHLADAGGNRAVRLWDASDLTLRVTLVPLVGGGSAVLLDDLRYVVDGVPQGEFWYAAGLCRFEPGELDAYLPALRQVQPGTRLW